MNLITLGVTAAFALVVTGWLPRSQLTLSGRNAVDLAASAVALALSHAVATYVLRRLSHDRSRIAGGIRHASNSILIAIRFAALFIPLGFIGSIYMYLASAAGLRLMDAELARLDALLGFDWAGCLAFFNSKPWLADLLVASYHSLGPQVPLLVAVLALNGLEARLQELNALMAVTSLLTAIGMVLVPAAGAYTFYAPAAEAFDSFTRHAGTWHLAELNRLRSGEPFLFTSTASTGLVTFPSYHTALGIVVTYAARGVRFVFPAFIVTNALMVVATLPEGGHYLTDVIAGGAIGLVSLLAMRRCEAPAAESASPRTSMPAAALKSR